MGGGGGGGGGGGAELVMYATFVLLHGTNRFLQEISQYSSVVCTGVFYSDCE